MVVDLLEWTLAAERRPRVDPARVALLWPGGSLTYGELNRSVDERARALTAEGVDAGAVCPTVASNDVNGIVALLATWRCGATVAPLNPRLTRLEADGARAALAGVAEGNRAGLTGAAGAQVILWTSGTSGVPRGVALSFDNLCASTAAVGDRLGSSVDDVWLASLSIAHVGGLALVVRALITGAAVFAPGAFDVEVASKLIDGRQLTHVSLVPTQLLRLLDHRTEGPPPTFRCALIGGAHAPTDLVTRALDAGWPISLTYGMTEMSSQVATSPPTHVRAKPGALGKPLEGVELKIDGGGEILLRGRTRAIGYVGGDEAIADADGWYHTGDIGHVDGDGDLWVTGRRIDRIVSGGVTVDAFEVEKALRAHPAVADACVIGVSDAEWGEVIGACVVPAGDEFDLDAVDESLRDRLSSAKRPRLWWIEKELPLNANGKVDRARVKAALELGRSL
jgi:O-succinylbenzoic acid--CoA ligase